MALAIGVFVAVRAVILGRQVLAVLGRHVPEGVDIDAVAAGLGDPDGVEDVHDLHLWTLTSGMRVATAYLVVADAAEVPTILDGARALLRDKHGLAHATVQVEPRVSKTCKELDW